MRISFILLFLINCFDIQAKDIRDDIFNTAMELQLKNKNKDFIKGWYLLRTLDQVSDEKFENHKKMLASLWQSSEKLDLCKNKMAEDEYGFHFLSEFNQRLRPSVSDKDLLEVPALESFRGGKQTRFIGYNDAISKDEWKSLKLIKNDCLFVSEYDEDSEIDEELYDNQEIWLSLERFKTGSKGYVSNEKLIDEQQYSIIIQSPALNKGDKEFLDKRYLEARKDLVRDLQSYTERDWIELDKQKFLYFYSFLLKNGDKTYTDQMTKKLLVNKRFTDEDQLILLIANYENKQEASDIYGERLCYLTSGDYAFYFCSYSIIKLRNRKPVKINKIFSLYSEIFSDPKIKSSDKKIAESSLVNDLMVFRLDSQSIEVIKNMEGLENKSSIIKVIVWQKNLRGVPKAYKLSKLLSNKSEAREDLFKPLNTGKTRKLLNKFRSAYLSRDNKTLRWFSELLTQLNDSDLDVILKNQNLIGGMSKTVEAYKDNQKTKTNYKRFTNQLDPINLNFSSETDKASSFNSKKTIKIGKLKRNFKNYKISWPKKEIPVPSPASNKLFLYLVSIKNFKWELSYESSRKVN